MNPILVLNIEVEDNNYDINVSPDKREVFIKNEDEVIEQLKIHLNEFFEDIQRTKAYDYQSVSAAASASNQKSIKSHFAPVQSEEPSTENNNGWLSKKRPYSDISSS